MSVSPPESPGLSTPSPDDPSTTTKPKLRSRKESRKRKRNTSVPSPGTESGDKRTTTAALDQVLTKRSGLVSSTTGETTVNTVTPVGEQESAETKAPQVGGENPIIITGDDDRPDIALLTLEPQSQDYLEGDYLYQTLTKIRNNPIFSKLLRDVAAVKPESWKAALDDHKKLPEEQRMPDKVLTRYAKVPESVGIVVLDRAGFDDLEYDADGRPSPAALYIAPLHLVELGQAEGTDDLPVDLKEGGNYWRYMQHTLFEFCNAAQRKKFLSIDAGAAAGKVNGDVYALAKEVLEFGSEERFDRLWPKVMNDRDCCSVIDDLTNEPLTLTPSAALKNKTYATIVGGSLYERLRNYLRAGHTKDYIEDWGAKYGKTYAERKYNIVEHVAELTGRTVDKDLANKFQKYAKGVLSRLSNRDPESKEDSSHSSTRKNSDSKQQKKKRKHGDTIATDGEKSVKGRKRKKPKRRRTGSANRHK